jgi:hypothetical protein
MGARVRGQGAPVTAPLRVEGRLALRGIDYVVPVASAQVKSAILFAALGATGPDDRARGRAHPHRPPRTCSRAPAGGRSSVDEREGCAASRSHPGSSPHRRTWRIPGDPSQAAFFAVLGCVHDCAVVEVLDIDAFAAAHRLRGRPGAHGRHVTLTARRHGRHAGEPEFAVARHRGLASEIPSVDEVPVLVVAAAAAEGVSAFRDMGELRVKESDRFEGPGAGGEAGLSGVGRGRRLLRRRPRQRQRLRPFDLRRRLDHRMVMASAVAGCAGAGCTSAAPRPSRRAIPGLLRRPGRARRERRHHRHRRAGRLGQVDRRARRRRAARLVLPRHRRDVPRGDLRSARYRGVDVHDEAAVGALADTLTLTTTPRVSVNGRDVQDEIRSDDDQRRGLGRRRQPLVRRHGVAPARVGPGPAPGHRRRGARHHHGRLSPTRPEGLLDGVAEERARRRGDESADSIARRDEADSTRVTSPLRQATTPSCSTRRVETSTTWRGR